MMLRVRGIWGGGWLPLVFHSILTPIRPIVNLVGRTFLNLFGKVRIGIDFFRCGQYYQIHYTPLAFGAPLYGCGAVINLSDAVYTK